MGACIGRLLIGFLAIAVIAGGGGAAADEKELPAASDPGPPPIEQHGFRRSPTYDETLDYLRRAAAACRHIRIASFGYSTEGRALPVVFVQDAGDGTFGWDDSGEKPVVLINAGIHSGEICGNDALQLLLRDIARGQRPEIVKHLRLILVPIFNVDGHARRSPYHRFTQVGPADGFGTRRNALRLDLNRDFSKLASPECQALVRLAAQFRPHVFVDLHTGDGFDHQYDIFFSANVDPTLPGERAAWVKDGLEPHMIAALEADGFRTFPYGWMRDDLDPFSGFTVFGLQNMYSTGHFENRMAISILSEAHAYVSFERRVRATRALLEAMLDYAAGHRIALIEAVNGAREEAIRWGREPGAHAIALACRADRDRPREVEFLGKAFDVITSPITGRTYPRYRDERVTYEIPLYGEMKPTVTATMPRGYLIERAHRDALTILRAHSIQVQALAEPFTAEVEVCHLSDPEFFAQPYQGRHPLTDVTVTRAMETHTFPAGTYWVPCDQHGGVVAMHLLEAESPDGLLVWNEFDTLFERAIVLEDWALEENAWRLMADGSVRAAYEAALEDSAFAADPDARLEFFFERTPYVEEEHNRYPVYRLLRSQPPPSLRE